MVTRNYQEEVTREEGWNKENSIVSINAVKKVKIGHNYAQLLKYAKS